MFSILAMVAFKKAVYDRILPISEVFKLIKEDKISKVLLGHYLSLSYFKSPSAGQWSYCISSLDPVYPREIWDNWYRSI